MAAETSALTRARSFLDRHHFTPFAHNPPRETPAERRQWLRLMLAGWLTMGGAILASTALIDSLFLLAELAVIALLAFPIVWRLHFSKMPRFYPNWIILTAAVVLGVVHWKLGVFTGGEAPSGMVLSYRVLVALFYWVMVFRAFTIRTVGDLTQTSLPAASGLLLIVIAAPTPVAFAGTALVIAGTLIMLAGEHSAHRSKTFDAMVGEKRVSGGRWRPKVNSWISLLLAAAVAAVVLAGVAAQIEPSNPVGRWLRGALADRLSQLMIRDRPAPFVAADSISLGGPSPRPLDRLMLTVRMESPVPMRTLAYEVYTGRSWERPDRELRHMTRTASGWRLPPPEQFGLSSIVTEEFEVQIVAGWGFVGALPVPWCPQELTISIPSLRTDSAGIVALSGYIAAGDAYTVTSAVPSAISAPAGTPEPPRVALENALQLPDDLPTRVKRLARQISAETRGHPAEIAMALEGHLKLNYPYDLDAPDLPEGMDFVDHFLFEAKRGWCNHYATAMVVMLRVLEIPARLATGFTAGEYVPGRDVYEIRDQDAHAWVEVYFEDTGWIDFDPTPDSGEIDQTVAGGVRRGFGEIGSVLGAAGRWLRMRSAEVAAATLATVAVVLAMTFFGRWYHRRLRPLRPGATTSERIVHCYRQALRWLERDGLERVASRAPWEYHRVAAQSRPLLADDLRELTGNYVRARYGSGTPDADSADSAERALRQIRVVIFHNGTEGAGRART